MSCDARLHKWSLQRASGFFLSFTRLKGCSILAQRVFEIVGFLWPVPLGRWWKAGLWWPWSHHFVQSCNSQFLLCIDAVSAMRRLRASYSIFLLFSFISVRQGHSHGLCNSCIPSDRCHNIWSALTSDIEEITSFSQKCARLLQGFPDHPRDRRWTNSKDVYAW